MRFTVNSSNQSYIFVDGNYINTISFVHTEEANKKIRHYSIEISHKSKTYYLEKTMIFDEISEKYSLENREVYKVYANH